MQFEKHDKLKHYKKHTCKNEWKSISFLFINRNCSKTKTVQNKNLFSCNVLLGKYESRIIKEDRENS